MKESPEKRGTSLPPVKLRLSSESADVKPPKVRKSDEQVRPPSARAPAQPLLNVDAVFGVSKHGRQQKLNPLVAKALRDETLLLEDEDEG